MLRPLILGASLLAAPLHAAGVTFDVDPLAGVADAVPGDGTRVIFGTDALQLQDFDPTADAFAFDLAALSIDAPLRFEAGLGSDLSGEGNAVVVLNEDDDDDPATPFVAGTAANLVAEATEAAGAGVFVYFNSALGLNRLVYSRDLSDATADLAILAAVLQPTGDDAVAALGDYGAGTFQEVAPVPLPAALPALLAGLGALVALRRRTR